MLMRIVLSARTSERNVCSAMVASAAGFPNIVNDDRQLVLENSDWFFNAVQMHLMKEDKVFEMVLTIIDELQKRDTPPNTRVQMEINTRLF